MESECGQGAALVLTGMEKFFCNGLNLEKVMTLSPEEMNLFSRRMAEIHSRFLILPCPTVAAMNGHAFAGGAFMALSCDYRLMREDRGWFSVSEVDVGVPVPPAMMGILQGKLAANTGTGRPAHRQALYGGRGHGGGYRRRQGLHGGAP